MKKFLALLLSVVTAFAFSSVLTACTPTEPEDTGVKFYYSVGVLGATITDFEITKEGTTKLVIPSKVSDGNGGSVNVVAIADGVFNANDVEVPFTSITLPNTLQRIGSYAFAGIECASITLPASLKVIEIGAFDGANIDSIVFKNTDGWMYHEVAYDQIQQDGILLAHPDVNINIADASVAAQYLTTADTDFDYSKACEGSVTPIPVPGKQPTGLAWLTLFKK